MPDQPTAVLRVEPHAIPALRAAYARALDDLRPLIRQIESQAYISEPWMGDPISIAVMQLYNGRFATGDNSPRAQLLRYEAELRNVVDSLTHMEAEYRRTEGDNAELWGRRA
jgi:hypothetical protein